MARIFVVEHKLILPPSAQPARKPATWGHVLVKDDPGHPPLIHVHRPQKTVERKLYAWVPDKVLQRLVPDGTVVILRCETLQDGERRFSPIGVGNRSLDPFRPFFAFAFASGFAILRKAKPSRMTKVYRQSYRMMWFLFQRAQKMRQHIRRAFNSKRELTIRQIARNSKDPTECHVLPWMFDASTKNKGYPQSVAELITRGEDAARQAGIASPNASQRIHYGLTEVARLEPKPLEPAKVVLVLKAILFNVDPTRPPVLPAIREHVEERIATAIWPHLDKDSAVFDDWFWGKHNSFIKQIAKQKKSPGGELDPKVVEQVLLDLGWESFVHVGQCVHSWAYDMLKAMPDALSASERRAFEMLYLAHPKFGGVPLILLAEKLQFVDSVLDDIVNHPGDDRPLQVLYRLLQFYSAMVSNRREADVRIQEALKNEDKRLRKKTGQKHSKDSSNAKELQDKTDEESQHECRDAAEVIYQAVAKAKSITCKCSTPVWSGTPEGLEGAAKFRIIFRCTKCKTTRSRILSVEELQDIAARLK